MKLFLLTVFAATVFHVNAGKTQRLLAALNAGVLPGMNGGMAAGLNGGMANAVNPGMMAGGLNRPLVAAGAGVGVLGQPQFAQLVPFPFAVPGPVPNMYPVPAAAVNMLPYMAVPQMVPVNPPQQPLMGIAGGVMQQQPPPQPNPLTRFRRQITKDNNALETDATTQIPAPTEKLTTGNGCNQSDEV
ncbi:secretory calcium-binding phosphoprotein 9 [Nelusetta ayraudi]|uniref:secretory calcium-binding phosphoprotein 9 n=1 Tax=Nelusetta ayraudi TaxID=303726 RepID=UPI003F70D6B9